MHTDVPNVAGWNRYPITFKTVSSNYRVLIHDKNRPEVLSRGLGVFTATLLTETVGVV